MNKYYANIIEQMGYWIMNDNPIVPQLFYKDNDDVVKVDHANNYWRFEDRDIWDNHKSIKIFENGNIDFRFDESMVISAYDDASAIYNVKISGAYGSDVSIVVSEYPLTDKNIVTAKINVIVRHSLDKVDNMTIEQDLGNAVVLLNNEKVKDITAKNCTQHNFINIITEYLSNLEYESSKESITKNDMCIEVLNGLKIILPSLKLSIDDILDYWKNYAIPRALSLKVREKANLEKEQEAMDKKYTESIIKANQEIYALQSIVSESKKSNKKIDTKYCDSEKEEIGGFVRT